MDANNDTVHCCLITDDNYIVPTATTIQSIVESRSQSTQLIVHVLAADLSDDSVSLLSNAASSQIGIDVRRVSVKDLKSLHVANQMGICMASPAALLKFSLADIFTELDRILYLDGDILVRDDLQSLFRLNLGESIVAAVRDLGVCWWRHAYAQRVSDYINTGVMLLDLRKMRDEKTSGKLFEAKRTHTDSMFMDQDIFNIVFDKRILLLPLRYNASMPQMIWSYRRGSYSFSDLNAYYACDYHDFRTIHDDAAIIHYSSKYKPWKFSNAPFGEEWREMFGRSVASTLPLKLEEARDDYLGFPWERWLVRSLPDVEMADVVDREYRTMADKAHRLEVEMDKRVAAGTKKACEPVQRENRALRMEVELARADYNALLLERRYSEATVTRRESGHRIVVSLTSYPARMGSVHKAIESIYNQTMPPDEVVLWLSRQQFPECKVPCSLDYCIAKGLKIRWVDDDIKPHKKYLFAMQEYPDDIVVTIDDDAIYPSTRIEELYRSHLRCPNAVVAARVHRMTFSADGAILPYAQWEKNSIRFINRPMYSLCAVGVGGVLYPPRCLPSGAYNVEAIKSVCLCADDIWLKFMEVVAGVPVVRADSENLSELTVAGSQETALWKTNCGKSANDIQLEKVSEYCNQEFGGIRPLEYIYSHYSQEAQVGNELPNGIPVRNPARPVVSVIVPVCNVAKYLERSISSFRVALERFGLPAEMIFVEDGSTDGSDEVLRSFASKDDRIGVIWQRNCGAGVARNCGLEAARGEFVCFCDPDDWIDPLMIDKLYRRAVADGSDVVLCGRRLFDDKQKRFTGVSLYEGVLMERFPHGFAPEDVAEKIFNAFYYVPWGKIIRRKLLVENGIRFPDMPRNEDISFANSVLVAAKRISIVNEALYVYRRNRVGSLQFGVEKTPYSQIEACRHTYAFLLASGRHDLYKNSFRKFVFMESAVRVRDLQSSRALAEAFYRSLQEEYVKEFHLDEFTPEIMRMEMRRALAVLLRKGSMDEFLAALKPTPTPRAQGNDPVALAKELAEERKKTHACSMKLGAMTKEINVAKRRVRSLEMNVVSLKQSESYRLGLFLLWPARKIKGGVKCLRDNGIKYTVKHAIGKLLRKFGSSVKW